MNRIGTWTGSSPLGRRLMGALFAAAGTALLTTPWWAPPLLARMSFFRIREVVVDGARYVPTDSILARLALRPDASVWDDMEPLGPRVRTHTAIEDAVISRELPGRLRVVVRERTPVALAPSRTPRRGGTRPLVAYDGSGTELPIAPARVAIDAPVARSADSTMLSTLDALRREAPQLYRRLASARALNGGGMAVTLDDDLVVLVPREVPVARWLDIFPVLDDLARRGAQARELDLRFKEQVIARLGAP
jgi:cell division protein FtsQ